MSDEHGEPAPIPVGAWIVLGVMLVIGAAVLFWPSEQVSSRIGVVDTKAYTAAKREALCTPEREQALLRVVHMRRGLSIFVNPSTWAQLPLDTREAMGQYASVCWLDGEVVIFRDAMTGNELGSWLPRHGYRSEE